MEGGREGGRDRGMEGGRERKWCKNERMPRRKELPLNCYVESE